MFKTLTIIFLSLGFTIVAIFSFICITASISHIREIIKEAKLRKDAKLQEKF